MGRGGEGRGGEGKGRRGERRGGEGRGGKYVGVGGGKSTECTVHNQNKTHLHIQYVCIYVRTCTTFTWTYVVCTYVRVYHGLTYSMYVHEYNIQ